VDLPDLDQEAFTSNHPPCRSARTTRRIAAPLRAGHDRHGALPMGDFLQDDLAVAVAVWFPAGGLLMLAFLDLFLQSEADVISRPDEQPEKT
jgi:hypothetical protein